LSRGKSGGKRKADKLGGTVKGSPRGEGNPDLYLISGIADSRSG